MINNAAIQVARQARNVALRHPNSMDCTLWKKVINRVSTETPPTFGGMPTIGGMGVIDAEDEPDYTYAELADAKVVFLGLYQASQSNMIDTENGLNYAEAPIEALIECVLDPSATGWVLPDKPMIVTVFPGNGVVVTYQIVGTTGNINVPPYTRKYLLNPLNDSAEWPVAQDGSPAPEDPSTDNEWSEPPQW